MKPGAFAEGLRRDYGSNSGWLRHLEARLSRAAGGMSGFQKVDYSRVRRMVFVCKGNICRSAYAAARARQSGIEALSAGLEASPGRPAEPQMLQTAQSRGVDLSSHRTRSIQDIELSSGDLLIAFELGQAERLRELAPQCQVTLLGLESTPPRPHIEDPYGLSSEYFTSCCAVIDQAVSRVVLRMNSIWRGMHPVYVAEADTLGAIAVIRSLGFAGYPVHAVSSRANALGFESKFALKSAVAPPYSEPLFLDWFRSYVRNNKIRWIVPSEGLLLALRPVIREFAPMLPFSADPEILYAGLSKYDLFTGTSRRNTPPTLAVNFEDGLPPARDLETLGLPIFIKVDSVYANRGLGGQVIKADSIESALKVLDALRPDYRRAIVQGYVKGRGVGAFFVIKSGRVLAEFMHQRLHEVPHTGGASSFREGCFDAAIRADALSRVMEMRWEGPAMLEYRRDETTGDFNLIEMNGRFWGSLHLALYSGVDFPRILLDAYSRPDCPPEPLARYPLNVRCRLTFPSEVQYVWSRVKDPSLGVKERMGSVLEFFQLSFDPAIRSDLYFPGDRALFLIGLSRFITGTIRSIEDRVLSRGRIR